MNAAEPLLRVDLRHLAALKAVAETLSFSDAALQLGYTQSAVSHQIAALERVVGAKLVDRSKGRRVVSLTPAGQIVLRHTCAILGELRAVRADVTALEQDLESVIRIGTFEELGAQLLPAVLDGFLAACPRASVELRRAERPAPLLTLLETGELDLALTELPASRPGIEAAELRSDRYVLLLPAEGECSSWISLPEPPPDRIRGELPRHGIRPERVTRCDDVRTAQALVAKGLGAAVVPALSIDAGDRRVRIVELEAAGIAPRTIGVAWHAHRELSPAARELVDALARPASLVLSIPDRPSDSAHAAHLGSAA